VGKVDLRKNFRLSGRFGESNIDSGCKKLDERLSALTRQVVHARQMLSRERLSRDIQDSGHSVEQAVVTVMADVDLMVADITQRLASLTGAMHNISSLRDD
jgi:hypothetical protein